MMRCVIIMLLSLLLAACPGGWRTIMVSTYDLKPVQTDQIKYYEGYQDVHVRPAIKVADVLYVQMRSDNYDDLNIATSLHNKYRIEAWLSTDSRKVFIDSSSFTLQREENTAPLYPTVLITEERGVVKEFGKQPKTVCDFRGNNAKMQTSLIPVPVLTENYWPPKNYDDSVLCLRLVFDVSISDVPPQKQFQLSFKYLLDGEPKIAILYFYPLKYTVFRH